MTQHVKEAPGPSRFGELAKPVVVVVMICTIVGFLLGAIFMATDYVGSPTTFKGQVVFGVGLGLITCLIRFWGNMNEGVAYAILLMNLVVPYIDALTQTTPLGGAKQRRKARAKQAEPERSER